MEPVELRMVFDDRAALQRELESNLRLGRAFVKDERRTDVGEAPAVLSDCALVLVHPECGAELRLSAQVVMVAHVGPDGMTAGVELRPFNAGVAAEIEAFVGGSPDAAAPDDASEGHVDGDDGLAAAGPHAENDDTGCGHPTSTVPPHSKDVQVETRQAKLRKLSYNEQQKVARTGDLSDRVQVERLYGKSVWRSLLDNPKLTVPEVARIARKGTVPRPLIELILDNNTWIHATPVRRALMSNPKLTPEGILKLLRMTPKHELRLIHKGTAYTPFIREQARKLLG